MFSAFLISLTRKEEHSPALLLSVTLSSLSRTPSSLASGQFQQLADTSGLVCLPADFTMNLDLPGIIVSSGFIHRLHVRTVATVTEVVFTKFHCQYFVFLEELKIVFTDLICNIQGQAGWGSEQPDLVKDVPAHCKEAGLDDL